MSGADTDCLKCANNCIRPPVQVTNRQTGIVVTQAHLAESVFVDLQSRRLTGRQ